MKKRIWIPLAVASLMLLGALNPENPYGYYMLLRFVCCTVFAYVAFQAYQQKSHAWVFVFIALAVLYNPLIKIHFSREVWSALNILSVIVAVTAAFLLNGFGLQTISRIESPTKRRVVWAGIFLLLLGAIVLMAVVVDRNPAPTQHRKTRSYKS